MIEFDKLSLENLAKRCRKNILDSSLSAGASSAHFGGGLSIVEILTVLYGSIMNHKPSEPLWEERDRLILSKGHGCLGLYAVLAEFKYISHDELLSFEKSGSDLLGHPVINKKKGIEFSNGSLGMGLSLGIGLSLSAIKKNKKFNTYIVIGDGECNEGSIWEGVMLASSLKLSNLKIIIDNNGYQQTGSNKEILNIGEISPKLKSFGWDVIDVNGHDLKELHKALSKKSEKPIAICAKTIKGKGFSFSENNNDWHHKILTKSIYEQAVKELQE